jgi:ectoine hydroxylase-related dioxygenase (phytanoyl-CoA dioxygenase family)
MDELAERYRRDGFVKVDGLLAREEVEEIIEETARICAGRRGPIQGVEPIPEGEPAGDQVVKRYLAIHFPHKISPIILKYVAHPRIAGILTRVIGPNVKCMQSMLFMKNAGKPGQAWHQDEYYIPTRDRSLCGAWIAVDRAVVENGCLWVIPGSHRSGVIWPMRPHENFEEFDSGDMCYGWPHDEAKEAVPVEVDAGGVVFFNGYLLHCSHRNRAPSGFRRALVNHCMSAESYLPWSWDGRLELKEDMRDILMVAGTDPYAHKGIEKLTYPFLRAER